MTAHCLKSDGSLPGDPPLARFKNERDFISQSGYRKSTVDAMDWASAYIDHLERILLRIADGDGAQGSEYRRIARAAVLGEAIQNKGE
jgi:hypothetical protein